MGEVEDYSASGDGLPMFLIVEHDASVTPNFVGTRVPKINCR